MLYRPIYGMHCCSKTAYQILISQGCYRISSTVWKKSLSTFCHSRRRTATILCLGVPWPVPSANPSATHNWSGQNALPTFFQRLFSTDVHYKTLNDIVQRIEEGKIRKVIVMAGAGISVPSGIPDYRSPGTGIYYNLEKYNLPYPEAIFDIDYFSHTPEPFFVFAKELYPGNYQPNSAHYFVKLLHDKGLLHRMYTQNIDSLETIAGLPDEKLIEAHGSFSTATCRVCYKTYQGEDIKHDVMDDKVPICRRSLCNGVIKPDVVFFGEQLPKRFWYFEDDMPQADLLIVMGTSLEVQPFAGIADAVMPGVPRVLFNLEATGPFLDNPRRNDVVVAGDIVEKIEEFCDMCGWKSDLKDIMKPIKSGLDNSDK